MLRALLAVAALLAPVPGLLLFDAAPSAAGTAEEGEPSSYRADAPLEPVSQIVLDDADLPKPHGWFLVPITSDVEAYVQVEAKARDASGPAMTGSFLIASFAQADGQQPPGWGTVHGAYPLLEATAQGQRVACCPDLDNPVVQFYGSHGVNGMGARGFVAPDRPLWVGLAAYGWGEESRLKITVSSYDAELTRGAAKNGTEVAAYDLMALAREKGANVALAGQHVAGTTAKDVRLDLTPSRTGLLQVMYVADGPDADGRLSVVADGERLMDRHGVAEGYGVLVAQRAGPFSVALEELRAPGFPPSPLLNGEYSYLSVTALYADLDLPGSATYVHHGEWEDEDW